MLSRPERVLSVPLFLVGMTLLGAVAPLFAAESTTGSDAASQTQDASRAPAPMCLNVANIGRTSVPDMQHLVFHMRDGTVWENTLTRSCAGLTYSPWAWAVRGASQVCANTQRLRVLQTGVICTLGEFAPPRPGTKD